MMKRIFSIFMLLLVVSMGAWATEGDVIYSNDFSTKDQTDFATWLGTGKKPTGFSYAQLGRVGSFSIESGALVHTPTAGKSKSNVNNGEFGTFTEAITTATGSTNYVLSFDVTLTYVSHLASSTIFEISDESKKTVICLYATHTRSNSTTGATSYGYIVGGDNAFVMAEAAGKSTNAEGYFGSGTKHEIANVSETTGSKTYHVILDAQTNGLAKLTIKEGDNAVVDGVDINISSSTGLKYMYLSDYNSYEAAVSTITIDNLSIVEGAASTASTADYTVKYVANIGGEETEIKDQVVRTGIVDATVSLSDDDKKVIWYNDKKYIYSSDNASTSTIAEGNSTIVTLTFREAATYNYSLLSSLGETLVSASGFEGETVKVGYPHYQLKDGVLYEAGVTDKEYRKSITLSADNVSETVTYSAKEGVENVVFYAEGEDIEGMTVSTSGNIPVRASQAKAGVASENVAITTLPAGKYIFHVGAFTSNNSEQKIYVGYGETQYAFASSSNLNETASEEITLTEETAIKYFGTTSSGNAQLDYIYIEKTGDYVPVVTSYAVTISNEIENGTVVADPTSAKAGDEVTLTNTPAEGYEFVSYSVTCKTNNEAVIVTDGKFTMPADDVTVSATFQLPAPATYAVTISDEIENGTVAVNPTTAKAGEEVTITATPAEGYELVSVSVTGVTSNEAVIVTDGKFTMPADGVTVNAKFQQKATPTIYIETDLTAKFNSLATTQWTGSSGQVGWAAPKVKTNSGLEVAAWERYNESCDWTGDIMSSSVTGLVPGTYKIELYGAAAFTFGRGFGSTAFTGDFSKDTSDTYKENESIDENTGVTLYAETAEGKVSKEIPIWYATNFNTSGIATATLENVIVGESGEIKIGLSKTSTSTNWHVVQLKGVTAQVPAADALADAVATAKSVEENSIPAKAYSALQTVITENDKVFNTAEEYQAAIAAINEATATANAFVAPYAEWKKVAPIATMVGVELPDISEMTSDELAATAQNLYVEMYNQTTTKLADDSKLLGDWTDAPGTNKSESWDGTAEDTYYDAWNKDPFAMTQTVVLPAGKYVLMLKARASAGAGIDMTDGTTTIDMPKKGSVGLGIQTDGTPSYSSNGVFANNNLGRGWEYRFLPFASDGTTATTLTINWDTRNAQWIGVDDIQLYGPQFYNINIAEGIENGTVAADPTSANAGAEVTLTNTPAEGYEFVSYSVTCKTNNEAVIVTDGKFTMPADDVTVSATFAKVYAVTISNEIENGTVVADPTSAKEGDEVTLTNTPAEGYGFVSYSVTGKTIDEAVIVTDGKFTMPADDVTVNATFAKVYAVKIAIGMQNGTVEGPASAAAEEKVTLKVTPAEGYELETLTIKCEESQNEINYDVVDYSFTMPSEPVNIVATFKEKAVDPSGDEEVALAADMFYTWDGYGADASKIASATVDFKVGESVDQGATVVGTGSVDYLTYADMTGSTKVIFEGTNGTEIRLLMNRQESNNGPLVEKNATITDGKAEISLTDLAYVHINAIKIPWNNSTGNIISAIKFVKPNDPLAGPKEALKDAIAEAKMQNSVAKTEESFAALTKAITDGEAALADAQATAESLTTAKSDIETAVKGLTLAEGYAEVTKEMFKQYASVDEPGEGTATTGAYELFTASDLPYGDGSVSELKWADLTKYDKLIVTVAGTTAPRLCMNRLVKDGQQAATQEDSKMLDINPNNGNTWSTEKYQTVADGVYTIDLAAIVKDYSFARLHCIKKQGWGAGVVVTGMYLHEAPAYTVNIAEGIENGTVSVDPTSAVAGEKVTLTATPAEGYTLASVSVTGVHKELAVEVTDGKFTMPDDDVTVNATFEKTPYSIEYALGMQNGTVEGPATAAAGEKVTLTVTPAEGYELENLTITCAESQNEINYDVVDYSFTMPAEGVYVIATFKKKVIYIETDLTEKFSALTDWHNWKGATGYTATNFCPEVTTNAGKKVQVCEKYESTCTSKGEIFTQTVTGLTPGTYKIELYGGAAFTFGRGFGSMAFTGDLSKATSDTYQAGDRIEPTGAVSTGVSLTATTSEGVYGGEIPIYYATNFPDGAAVVTLNDVAIGENGTITIGMNKEGEDTNWHVIQLKGVTAQVPAADVLADAVEAAKSIAESDVPAVLYSRLQQTIADYNKEYSTAEEYLNAISAINNVVDIAKGYMPLSAVLNEGAQYKANVPAEDPAIAAYDAAIADVKAAYDATAVADIPASVKVVEAALPALAKAQTAPGSDMTRAIVNNGFEDGNLNGWENLGTAPAQVQNNASFELKSGNWYAEAWHKSGVINLAQTITGLPAGKYTLKADISSQAADAVLYANKAETAIDANASGTFEVEGIIVSPSDGNEMTIGFKWTDESKYWNCMDNFRLVLVEAIETYSIEYALGMQNGTVTGPTAAVEGETVTLTVTPAEGYELENLTITCAESQNEINYDVVDYSFTMPKEGVYIIATFVQTTGIDAASAAKGKKIGVKKYFKNGELIIIGKDGKEFRANGAAK